MSTTKITDLAATDGGYRLADAGYIRNGLLYLNSAQSTYGIVGAGTTQATATPLNSVLNQIDTTAANTGVNLPFSGGKHNTPYQFCIIINNGANSLNVYGAQNTTDQINGVAGSTAAVIPAGGTGLFNSAKVGAWFSGDVAGPADFAGNITETLLGTGFVQKAGTNGRAGTFSISGTNTITVSNTTTAITDFIGMSLNSASGTVSLTPHVTSISAGVYFTVVGMAGDSSTYNYSMFGVN